MLYERTNFVHYGSHFLQLVRANIRTVGEAEIYEKPFPKEILGFPHCTLGVD